MHGRAFAFRTCATLATFALLAPSVRALAQEVTEVEEETTEEDASRWSGTVQFDFTNAYFFRGLLNERSDFIWQPWAELYLNLYSSDEGLIRDVSVGIGVWNSVHEDKTLAEHSPKALYETDWYPIVSVGLPQGLTWTTYYYFYTSPSGAFDTVQEVDFRVDWDDSEVLKAFPLAPWMNWAVETDRTSNGEDKGVGLEMGVEPTLFTFDSKEYPLALSAPVEIGLSVTDYYENDDGANEVFGYITYGLALNLPLEFLHPSWGHVSVGFSAKGLHLGNSLAEVNGGDDNYGIVMGSIGVEF